GGAEHQCGDRVGDAGVCEGVDPPQHQVGELSGFQGADLACAAEHSGAAVGAEPACLPCGERGLAVPAEAVDQQGVAQFGVEFAGLVGGGAVHAQADGDAGGEQVRDAGDPRGQAGVGGGAVGDAGTGAGEGGDVGVVHVDAVRHPHVLAEPAGGLEVVGGAHAELVVAVLLLLPGLRAVGVQAHPEPAGQSGGLAQQFGGDGEGRAGGDGDLRHRVGGGVVVPGDGLLGGGEGLVEGHDGEVGGQAAVLFAAVHGAPGEGEAHTHVTGGGDDRAGQVAGAAREDVVVVHGGG